MLKRKAAVLEKQRPPVDPIYTAELITSVRKLRENAERSGEYVSAWSLIEAQCMKAGVFGKQRFKVSHVGTSPYSRGGLGVARGDAQKHLCDIVSVGFAWSRLEAYCKQVGQFDPQAELDFQSQQVELSNGLIPPTTQTLAVSAGGSHTS